MFDRGIYESRFILNLSVVDAVIFTSAKGVVFCSSVGLLVGYWKNLFTDINEIWRKVRPRAGEEVIRIFSRNPDPGADPEILDCRMDIFSILQRTTAFYRIVNLIVVNIIMLIIDFDVL